MGIIVDIVLIAIIILSAGLAYKKGLVSLGVKLFAFVIAIVITLILYKPVASFVINVTSIDETIENAIFEKANEMIEGENNDSITNQVIEGAKNDLLPSTARSLAVNIVTFGVIILLYIIARFAIRFIDALATFVKKLPILKQVDKLGGVAYGLIRGIILAYAILLIIAIAEGITPENQVSTAVSKSYITKVMYENNILNILF